MSDTKHTPKPEALVIALAILLGFAISALCIAKAERRPTIFILREEIVETYDKGPATVVDYYVNGVMSNAYFYEDEMGEYQDFIRYLEAIGIVKRGRK